MIEMTDVIVSILFLPVTVFIIIPLVMLCGWLFFKLFMLLTFRREKEKEKNQLKNVVVPTWGSR